MTLGVRTLGSLVDCNLFQTACFVVARFLLTSASRGPSTTAELLVYFVVIKHELAYITATRRRWLLTSRVVVHRQ